MLCIFAGTYCRAAISMEKKFENKFSNDTLTQFYRHAGEMQERGKHEIKCHRSCI